MQVGIRLNFTRALSTWERLSNSQRELVQKLAEDLYEIKKETEQTAITFGYSSVCRASIAVCRGECCRLYYPKTFSAADFLVIIGSLTPRECEELAHRILLGSSVSNGKCILLMKDGCILSFKSRPMVCTNAYPCFAGRVYWEIKEAGNRRAKTLFESLNDLILKTINSK